MTQFQCHYQSLKVTRDAPLEVIRAAYRSLSQKHHPDKNSGNPEAARMMSRLNFAYSVLSDPDQRELYDLQIQHEQRARESYAFQEPVDAAYDGGAAGHTVETDTRRPSNATNSLLHRIRLLARGRNSQIAGMAIVVFVVALVLVVWSTWREHQAMVLLEHAALPAPGAIAAGPVAAPPQVGAVGNVAPASSSLKSGSAQPSTPVAAPKAPDAPVAVAKSSEFERLAAMLKSMGLGLHKLDLATQPATAKQPATKPAEPEKPAVVASANPVPAARAPTASAPAPVETARPREESERPTAPDVARAEAKPAVDSSRANAAPATANTASASAAPVPAVIVDMRTCVPPTYPPNAYSNGESGTVQLALLVGSDGRVIESKVQKSSGFSELNKAARKALSQCRFKVPNSDGKAEPVWTTLEYVFKLD